MIYFIEFWNAKAEWMALSTEEREAYMNQVGGAVHELLNQGVEILTWSKNETSTEKRAEYDYFAIWAFPDLEIANSFQKTVEEAGWYNYFEQVNAMGKQASVEEVIGHLVQL